MRNRTTFLRAVLEQVDALIQADNKKAALALVRDVARVVPMHLLRRCSGK